MNTDGQGLIRSNWVTLPLTVLRLVGAWALASAAFAVAESGPAAAPIEIDAPELKQLDLTKTDGGLLPAPGAQNFGVFRASPTRPDLAEGNGYAYNHHPDLAVWHGRFYVAWDSGQKDEDTWPARELYSTSVNGRDWSAPAELFPQGVSTPTRLYFFHAPNGRMLAFAGLRIDHAKTNEGTKGPIVVREIRADHSLGEVYTARAPASGSRPGDPPLYPGAKDPDFVTACRQLLRAKMTLETQDNGVFLDPVERIKWHDPAAWPNGKLGRGFWKAPSFYHRGDGAIVGIGKNGWTTVSADSGATWSLPVVPPTLHTNNAKVWGQRTGDGRFALVYNPTPRPRYPLMVVSGDDGITFRDPRAVQTHFPTQRYPGVNKNVGLQYVRGIAEWASDGSIADAQRALWLVYSANKEDIWVSRVPLPTDAPATESNWNVYQPKWSTVTTVGADVRLETTEPYDRPEAVRLFAPASKLTARFTVTTPPAGLGAVDIELLAGQGGARAVRLRFVGDGALRALDGEKMVEFGQYAPHARLSVRLEADCMRHVYTVAIDGHTVGEARFTEPVAALQRFAVRVWARADADRPTDFLPATASVGPEFGAPATRVACAITGLEITAAN